MELIGLVIFLRCLTFLLGFLTLALTVLLFWISFFLLIYSTLAFLPLGNSDNVVVSVSINFRSTQNGKPRFIAELLAILVLIRVAFVIIWEMFHGKISLNSAAAGSEFCEWFQLGVVVYNPHRNYQVKPHLSPWFSAVCAAAIVHRNTFFCLYQQNKSSESKVKFRQASNCCKRVLEAAKLAYANKTK